jgi:O-antigen ligase
MPDRHARCPHAALPVLTPRSAAADHAAPAQRVAADAVSVDMPVWIEVALGFLPFVAWLVAGVIHMRGLAIAAYLAIGLMLIVRPRIGYLALLPMLPFFHPQGFPPHGPIFLLAGLGLASVLVRLSIGRVRVPLSARPALWCAVAFLALTAFQLFLGVRTLGGAIPLSSLSQYDQVFIILAVFAVGLVVLPGRVLAPYHAAFLVAFALVVGVGLVNFFQPGLLEVFRLDWLVHPNAFEDRASGVIANPNFLGLALACGLSWIIVSALWHFAHGRIDRATLLLPIIPPAGLTMILTFSRTALLALGIGLIAALARRSWMAAGVLAAAAAIAATLIYPVFIQVRLGQTFGEASPAAEAAIAESDRLRSLMADSAIRAFLDAPLAGHGFSTFSQISPTYSGQSTLTSAHDLYLKVAAEQGLIGLSVLGALFISIVVPIWRAGLGPWVAAMAVALAFMLFSFTADTFGSAQTVASAFFLMAAGVAQAAFTREQTLARQRLVKAAYWPADAEPSRDRAIG